VFGFRFFFYIFICPFFCRVLCFFATAGIPLANSARRWLRPLLSMKKLFTCVNQPGTWVCECVYRTLTYSHTHTHRAENKEPNENISRRGELFITAIFRGQQKYKTRFYQIVSFCKQFFLNTLLWGFFLIKNYFHLFLIYKWIFNIISC